MSRTQPRTPRYLQHKATGQAYTYVYEGNTRRQIYLGPWDSPESHRAYRRVMVAFYSGKSVGTGRTARTAPEPSGYPQIKEVAARFLLHAASYYKRADGTPTGELVNFRCALEPLLVLYRDTPVDSFGILELESVREEMVDRGWSRPYINANIGRIRRIIRWAITKRLAPPGLWEELRALPGLQRGRSDAREPEPIGPADLEAVRQTLPHLPRQLRTMALLQLSTGMRPGEVCGLSMDDIDTSNDIWIYRPSQHKNAHRGRSREIPLLAEDQELLRPFIRTDGKPLFSPAEAEAERRAMLRKQRQTPMTPSQAARTPKPNPKRVPGDRYDTRAYAHAVRRACKRAGVERWAPNMLRKRAATDLNAALFNRDAVRQLLGHHDDRSVVHYVQEDATNVIEIRRRFASVRNGNKSQPTERDDNRRSSQLRADL